jgi:cobalamin biosynthesis Mg chelatase CobN
MKTGRVRASALLAGVAIACAIPAVAWGQLDPDKVGNTVTDVTKQVPQVPSQVQKQLPKLPSTPVTKAPNGQSAPQAPSNAGGGSSSRSSTPSTSRSTSSGSAGTSSSGSSGTKAHAASSNKKASSSSSKGAVSGQQQASPSDAPKKVASVAATARPNTGTGDDSKLPFTGYALILVGLLGVMALVGGAGLRGATHLRFARKRA